MSAPLPTGSTIGIIGGGQLGRMLAMAASKSACSCFSFANSRRNSLCS
jgi:5-(carboxyamino)imidazole ribonucleotide synthase